MKNIMLVFVMVLFMGCASDNGFDESCECIERTGTVKIELFNIDDFIETKDKVCTACFDRVIVRFPLDAGGYDEVAQVCF